MSSDVILRGITSSHVIWRQKKKIIYNILTSIFDPDNFSVNDKVTLTCFHYKFQRQSKRVLCQACRTSGRGVRIASAQADIQRWRHVARFHVESNLVLELTTADRVEGDRIGHGDKGQLAVDVKLDVVAGLCWIEEDFACEWGNGVERVGELSVSGGRGGGVDIGRKADGDV